VTSVRSSVQIAAPPQKVWDVIMDPARLSEWVTIHRELREHSPPPAHAGSIMEQILHVRGADIRVHWLLVECREPHHARWEGHGPARSIAHIEYHLTAVADGTRFDYQNEFRPPLGAVGALASRTVMGNAPRREADRSLAALRLLVEAGPA
jgi:uncharacterized protein YndB with AHSA1/START domain